MNELVDKYAVICDGTILKLPSGKVMKHQIDRSGYHRVWLTTDIGRKSYSVHRLVAQKYVYNTEDKPEVNHIDGDKGNNHYKNLEWVTHAENMAHAASHPKIQCGNENLDSRDEMILYLLEKYTNREVADLISTTESNVTRIRTKHGFEK